MLLYALTKLNNIIKFKIMGYNIYISDERLKI